MYAPAFCRALAALGDRSLTAGPAVSASRAQPTSRTIDWHDEVEPAKAGTGRPPIILLPPGPPVAPPPGTNLIFTGPGNNDVVVPTTANHCRMPGTRNRRRLKRIESLRRSQVKTWSLADIDTVVACTRRRTDRRLGGERHDLRCFIGPAARESRSSIRAACRRRCKCAGPCGGRRCCYPGHHLWVDVGLAAGLD